MQILLVLAALCGVWVAVDGAAVIVNPWMLKNSSMTDFQMQCMMKIQNSETIIMDATNVKFSVMGVLIRMMKRMEEEGNLDSLDNAIQEECHTKINKGVLYSLTMDIVKECMDQDDPFTLEEQEVIKNKLLRIACDVYLKLVTIAAFSPECLANEPTMTEILKCKENRPFPTKTPIREFFYGNPEICENQAKAVECVNQAVKDQCSASISNRIYSLLADSQVILGCSEPNSVVVVNSV